MCEVFILSTTRLHITKNTNMHIFSSLCQTCFQPIKIKLKRCFFCSHNRDEFTKGSVKNKIFFKLWYYVQTIFIEMTKIILITTAIYLFFPKKFIARERNIDNAPSKEKKNVNLKEIKDLAQN